MSFSAAANVITQTGTDTNLSGLTGVTGVTVTTLGGVSKYSLNSSTSMVVSGTLTIDPRINFLEILKDGDTTLRVSSTGVMTIGAILTYSFATQYTTGIAISMVGRSTQPFTGNIKNDGIFIWYGATIDAAGGFRAIAGSSTTIRDGVFVSRLTQSGTTQGNQIFFEGGTCDIIGLTKTLTGAMTFDNAAVGFVGATTITNLKKVNSTGSVSADYRVASPNASIPYVTVTEFSPVQLSICEPITALAYIVDCGNIYAATQSLKRRDAYGTVTEQGQIEAYKTCNGTVTYGGAAVLGTKIYWKDANNGVRGTAAATAWGRTYTADRIYTATTGASGLFTLNVMEAAWYTTNAAAGTNDTPVAADRRLESGEFITSKACGYLYTLVSIRFNGNVLGASAVTSPQALDASITESTKATVDAYTTIGTAQKFYDRAKSYLYDNFAGETATMVTRSGNDINAGAYNVVIDSAAGSAFAFSGSTITIKESLYVGSITTTGTVTLTGADIIGTIIDSGGTRAGGQLQISGLVAASVYLTDNTGAQVDYQTGITGTYTRNIPAGSTGTWTWRVAKYGNIQETATFSAATGGIFSAALANVADTSVTQPTLATVLAYTTLENWDKVYDYCQAYLTTTGGKALPQFATKNGAAVDLGSYALTVDSAAGTVFALSTGITIKATALDTGTLFAGGITTGAVSTAGAAVINTWYTSAAGRSVLITAPSIIVDSRAWLYNETGATTIDNSIVVAGGVRFRLLWTADITVKLTATCLDCVRLATTSALTNTGLSILATQTTDAVYIDNGVSGPACDSSNGGEFTADLPNVQIDINDADNSTDLARAYAWAKYYETTATGIVSFLNCITATDTANYFVDGTVVDLAFDNKKTALLTIGGGFITKTGGTSLVASTTTGSIYFNSGKAFLANSSSIISSLSTKPTLAQIEASTVLAKESSVQIGIAFSA
jgi:hypothetical protein